ncbi:MAG: hypothetical protein C4316_08760, partial [Chloroflexota bacterium]
MQQLSLRLEAVTPLFLGGADHRYFYVEACQRALWVYVASVLVSRRKPLMRSGDILRLCLDLDTFTEQLREASYLYADTRIPSVRLYDHLRLTAG